MKNAIFINKPTIISSVLNSFPPLPLLLNPSSFLSLPLFFFKFELESIPRSKLLHPSLFPLRERESGGGWRKRRNGSRPRGEPREKYRRGKKTLRLRGWPGPFLRVFLVFSDPPSFREILSILVFISPYAICRLAAALSSARATSLACNHRARKRRAFVSFPFPSGTPV